MPYLKMPFAEPTLIIDGDLFLYRATTSVEEETQWSENIWSLATDIDAAKRVFNNMIENFKSQLMVDKVVLTFTGTKNFRRSVEETYKTQRKKTRKPVGYAALLDWCAEEYEAITIDCLEADDIMGIICSMPGTKAICVSDDKDMMGIPGKLYRPQGNERMDITLEEADAFFLKQALMGDMTDGYAGLKGCGPKSAEKILGSRPTWEAVVKAYADQDFSEEYALTQARLARILRADDWDDEKQEPILWDPRKWVRGV